MRRLSLALGFLALWLVPAPLRAAAAPEPFQAIAIAEDQRRYSDGVLRRFLAHGDAEVRARAALAVGRLQDSTAVPDLVPLLKDQNAAVRREATFALGQIGHRSAAAPLVGLLGESDLDLVDLALEALGKLGDRSITPRVASFLGHSAPLLRGEAAVALWRLADATAVDALIERHQDQEPEVRWRILYALEKIVDPDRIVLVTALHLDDPDPQVRAQAARTLGRQKAARGTAYLVQRLEDPEPAVVVNALRSLQQIGDSTCTLCPPALLRMLGHSHPYVRVSAATVLAERFVWAAADTAAHRALEDSLTGRVLRDVDAATRGASARALVALRGEQALSRIAPVLTDSSIYARAAAVQALARLPAARALPLLLPRLEPTTPVFERMSAAEALGSLKDPKAVHALRDGLADSSSLFVAACASALAELGDSAGVAFLAKAYAAHARDPDADARLSIRDALRTLAGQTAADSIERRNPAPAAKPSYPADFHQPASVRGAVLRTTAGEIEVAFYREEATQTVKNFVRLAERGYFNGLQVHRVVPNFVIQDGDPTGTGSGGPGYTIRCEYNRLRYEPGMVGMALSGKDTGGSQWFVTHAPQPHLNGRYTIFARLIRGLDVVRRVVQGDRVISVELIR